MEGRDVVVISPSATGKTEAVTAPVIERSLQITAPRQRTEHNCLAVLYVSPTRALVNDLYRRLQEPMEYLGLELARKTGDHPAIEKKKLPFLLLTTPESFDSLLCRHPAIFKRLAAVVLDELHLVDGTPRGDQLRLLLQRLRQINAGIQYCALSATIDDENIGLRYFAEPLVIKVNTCREIEQLLLPLTEDWPQQVVSTLTSKGCRKLLFFFNSRAWAESSAGKVEIPPFCGRVWVHHASLNRRVREEVERRMNEERFGILCCTSTLELGIDIGDIDAVVLVRPPFNVSSLLQRIGRGNRRRERLLFVGLYADGWERFLFETYLQCCREGRLYEKRYTPSLSAIPQQVISYMYQRRRIGTTMQTLGRLFQPVYGRADFLSRVFRHLIDKGLIIEQRAGIYFLSSQLEKQIEYGKIHSNIQDKTFGKYEVYDVDTNRHLGTVFYLFRTFVLGGKAWELVEFQRKERRIMVKPFREMGAATRVFEGTGTGQYGYRMAQVLKSRLFPDLAPLEFPCFREADMLFVVHLLGNTYGYLLSEALSLQGVPAMDVDGKLLALPAGDAVASTFPLPDEDSIRQAVRKNVSRLEDSLGSGAFFRLLPPDLQVEDHMLALDINGLLEFLDSIRLVEWTASQISSLLSQQLGVQATKLALTF